MERISLPFCSTNSLKQFLVGGVVMVLLSGCIHSVQQYVPLPDQSKNLDNPELSRIYVLRPARFFGSGIGVPVADGDKPIGSVASGGFLSWEREPGSLKVQSVVHRHQSVELDVKAGERTYILQKVGYKKSPLIVLDKVRGEELLRGSESPRTGPMPSRMGEVFKTPTEIELEERFYGKGYLFPYYAIQSGGTGYGLRYSREVKSWLSGNVDVSVFKGIDYDVTYHGGALEGVQGEVKTDLSPIVQISLRVHPPFLSFIGIGVGMEAYSFSTKVKIKDKGFDLAGQKDGSRINAFYPVLSGGLYFVNRTYPYRITASLDFQVRSSNNREEILLRPPSGVGQYYVTHLNPLLGSTRFSFGIQFGQGRRN